jgi:hypothetical protein
MNLPFVASMATWPLLGEFTYDTAPDALVRQQMSNAFASGHKVPDAFIQGLPGDDL